MFKYDNKRKNSTSKNIIEYLKQSRGIIISMQSAERIAYLLSMRYIKIDSVGVSGQEISTGKSVETNINIKEINLTVIA